MAGRRASEKSAWRASGVIGVSEVGKVMTAEGSSGSEKK